MRKNFRNDRRKQKRPDTFDVIFRKFKKKAERDGIVKEVREREFFEKPSTKRNKIKQAWKRKKKLEAAKSNLKGYRRR